MCQYSSFNMCRRTFDLFTKEKKEVEDASGEVRKIEADNKFMSRYGGAEEQLTYMKNTQYASTPCKLNCMNLKVIGTDEISTTNWDIWSVKRGTTSYFNNNMNVLEKGMNGCMVVMGGALGSLSRNISMDNGLVRTAKEKITAHEEEGRRWRGAVHNARVEDDRVARKSKADGCTEEQFRSFTEHASDLFLVVKAICLHITRQEEWEVDEVVFGDGGGLASKLTEKGLWVVVGLGKDSVEVGVPGLKMEVELNAGDVFVCGEGIEMGINTHPDTRMKPKTVQQRYVMLHMSKCTSQGGVRTNEMRMKRLDHSVLTMHWSLDGIGACDVDATTEMGKTQLRSSRSLKKGDEGSIGLSDELWEVRGGSVDVYWEESCEWLRAEFVRRSLLQSQVVSPLSMSPLYLCTFSISTLYVEPSSSHGSPLHKTPNSHCPPPHRTVVTIACCGRVERCPFTEMMKSEKWKRLLLVEMKIMRIWSWKKRLEKWKRWLLVEMKIMRIWSWQKKTGFHY